MSVGRASCPRTLSACGSGCSCGLRTSQAPGAQGVGGSDVMHGQSEDRQPSPTVGTRLLRGPRMRCPFCVHTGVR